MPIPILLCVEGGEMIAALVLRMHGVHYIDNAYTCTFVLICMFLAGLMILNDVAAHHTDI